MFLNHRGLHYYSYLALDIIKSWENPRGWRKVAAIKALGVSVCSADRGQSRELLVMCASVAVLRQMKVSRDCQGVKDAGPGPSGSERRVEAL